MVRLRLVRKGVEKLASLTSDGKITLTTQVDTAGVKKGLSSLQGAVAKLGATIGVAFSVGALINFGKQAVNLASDLQEVQNVVDTAFGSMAYKIEEFSKTSIEAYGISKLTAKKTASTYMAMAKGMGIADESASDMAITMTGLSADIASFYNLSQERADTILKSVYTGETEALKQLGIVMTEVNLQNFAATKGITKKLSAMSQEEKTMLRYRFVLEQTKLAQGDFARTQDGWANQTRILTERWKEMQSVWGQAFMSLATLVLPTINNVIDALTRMGQTAQVAAQWVYKAFTGKTLEVDTAKDQANSIEEATQNQENLNSAIEDTTKKTKKALAGFDNLQILTSNTAKNAENGGVLGNLEAESQLASLKETGEGFNTEQFDVIKGYLEAISVLAITIGGSLLAWKISTVTTEGLQLMLTKLINISGALLIIAGTMLLVKGYTDAWVNGIDWNNLAEALTGLTLLVLGIALAISPVAATFVVLGGGIALIVIGIKDMIENGPTVQNVLTVVSGLLITILATLTIMGKLKFFTTLLPLLATIAGAFLFIKGAADAWVNGVDWKNLILMLGGAAIAITAIALTSDLLYVGIGLLVFGIVALVIAIKDMITNGVTAENTILAMAGAIATAIGVLIVMSKLFKFSMSPSLMLTVAGFAALAVGIGAVIGAWDDMSGAQKVISVLGILAVAAATAAIAFGSLQSAWSLGIAAAGIIAGIVAITASVKGASKDADAILQGYSGTQYQSFATDFSSSIPHLAKGAVIPPNKEFLAVLGDQKSGTNIEAPLDTIVQAMNMALSQSGGGGGSSTVVMQIDGREFGRAVIEQGNRENRRIGTRLVVT